ncbi:MAG: glutamate dehydrogenase [Psychroserpens sp.]|uniref:THC0290_0291 family protein n=1 Tax=Psychroserpens sp. TaxID=2020870 RepID=UPI003C70CF74
MMLNNKSLTLILFVFLLGINESFAQFGFTNEIGIVAGPVAFQSDFGERQDFETNAGNTGFGIGLVHYINFTYRRQYSAKNGANYFNYHFKVRNELSYNKINLDHFGQWVDEDRRSDAYEKLRRHSGSAQNINIGSQLEFFPLSIRQFEAMDYSFAPYISLGVQFTVTNPSVATTFGDGDINNSNNFFDSWVAATDPNFNEDPFLFNESSTVFSIVGSVGTRYKLTTLSDLVLDLKWQFFMDDRVDGLDHNLKSNKSNDWLMWINVGYIHYLNNN